MATIVRASGQFKFVTPEKGRQFSFKALQQVVGGYIALVGIGRGGDTVMVFNDDGLLQGLPRNHVASVLAGQNIGGDVLVCKKKEV